MSYTILEGPTGRPVTARSTADGAARTTSYGARRPNGDCLTPITAATLIRAADAEPLKLKSMQLRYTDAGIRYVFLFDKADVISPPSVAHAACLPFPIKSADGLLVIPFDTALVFSAGIVISLSSTESTYTLDPTGFTAQLIWE
jgi:hypothetical protein